MENILTAIILVVGSIILYWMYLSASKEVIKKSVNSSNKPFLNVQIQGEYEDEEQVSKKYVPPVNSYIQSVKGLDLDFSEDLTEIKVEEAYLTMVKRYLFYFENKQTPPYSIAEKEAFRNYLINSLRTKVKND
jgi:hypothetical protein